MSEQPILLLAREYNQWDEAHMRKLMAIAACSNALVIAPAIAQTPAESVILRGAYLTLASCAFLKLDKEGLRKADLQSSSRIEFVPGTVRIWLLNFEQISKSETRVTFTKSMWDPHDIYKYVMPAVRACSI